MFSFFKRLLGCDRRARNNQLRVFAYQLANAKSFTERLAACFAAHKETPTPHVEKVIMQSEIPDEQKTSLRGWLKFWDTWI